MKRGRRGSAVAGVTIVGAALLVGALAILYYQQSASRPRLGDSDLPSIQSALATAPANDLRGRDVPGLPRPEGSKRTYFLESAAVTSVVYTQHEDLLDVRHGLERALAGAGWTRLDTPTPNPLAESHRLWHEVFYSESAVLQVTMYRNGDVTATTYVVQKRPA